MSFYYNMDGSWYEEKGPDAEYVREYTFTKLKNTKGINDEELKKILMIHIPDTKTDFCSFKGFHTFGLDEDIFNAINSNIQNIIEQKRIKKAYQVLNDKFIPIVTHKLYEPNGFMTKVISKRTNVGKVNRKLNF